MGCHEELAYTSGHAWSKGARACQLFKVLKVELAAGTLAHLLFSKMWFIMKAYLVVNI